MGSDAGLVPGASKGSAETGRLRDIEEVALVVLLRAWWW